MGAKWILKRGGVGYPGVYQEQGAQLLASLHDQQGKCHEKPFAKKKTTTSSGTTGVSRRC